MRECNFCMLLGADPKLKPLKVAFWLMFYLDKKMLQLLCAQWLAPCSWPRLWSPCGATGQLWVPTCSKACHPPHPSTPTSCWSPCRSACPWWSAAAPFTRTLRTNSASQEASRFLFSFLRNAENNETKHIYSFWFGIIWLLLGKQRRPFPCELRLVCFARASLWFSPMEIHTKEAVD